ncbi:cobalamin B12-binding domain-containing protein [Streptomyces sp. NPDC054786]
MTGQDVACPLVPGVPAPARLPMSGRGTVVVSSMASDSHTWNLVFLQLLVEEYGYHVVNLGPCVPDEVLAEECRALRPAMVVLSSVNGHGYQDGLRVVDQLRACPELVSTPLVIGGKLGIAGELGHEQVDRLVAAGFDAVFDDGAQGLADFRQLLEAVPESAGIPV